MLRNTILLIIIFSAWTLSAQQITAEQALRRYIDNGDDSFKWECKDSLAKENYTAYRLRMRSQTWRGNEWIHELVVFVPKKILHREALIHISGGRSDEATA